MPRRARLDPEQDAERADLWERLRAGMQMPELVGERVRKWEQYYAARPDYVQRMAERGSRYLFHIIEEIERREMPLDLALLPFVESAFDPQALSRARAAGMWQFMPGTGRQFDLAQNVFRDERRDVLASTRAALDFLQRLYERFRDWHLALAAYNWGPGNVQRALDRNVRARQPAQYQALQRMPAETRDYVPKLQAIKNLVSRPQAFGISLPALENHPQFLSVAIERDIDVALAARLAGLTVEEFLQFNPQHTKPVILSAGTPQVLLPYDNANRFVHELARYSGPLATWTAWVAPRTLKAAEAAMLHGIGEQPLREVNGIPPQMLIRAGSALLVPRSAGTNTDVSEALAANGALALWPEAGNGSRRTVLRAGAKGDTVAAIARRHGLTAAQVAQWNQLGPTGRFAPGQQVVLMLPERAHKAAPSAHRPSQRPSRRTPAAARARIARR